jgi:NADH-quinone oxidoreductase subunit A
MLQEYIGVIIFMSVGLFIGIGPIVIGALLGTRKPDAAKVSPYECGFEAFEDSRMKFGIKFYLIAILFIIFDLEVAFLFPWAVVLDDIGGAGFIAMAVFMLELVLGFIYVWGKGALEWE